MNAATEFDVFVSYNTLDHKAVERIGRALEQRDLRVFLDRWELLPGRPWPDALEALTGQRQMDATAILDYFAPLSAWLDEQNAQRTCGW